MVKVIGITGLIASGKSTLSNYLKEKGYKIFDADYEVKKLYSNNDFLNILKKAFPTAFVNSILNKDILAQIVFSNLIKKNKLENLIHPIIEMKCDEFVKDNANEKVIFLDIPLLFEVGWDKKCNEIILVVIDKEIQKIRYIERGGKAELFEKIIKNQGYIEDKKSKSTYIIENNDSIKKFYDKIDKVMEKLSKNS